MGGDGDAHRIELQSFLKAGHRLEWKDRSDRKKRLAAMEYLEGQEQIVTNDHLFF
jgi:hypothetical protein